MTIDKDLRALYLFNLIDVYVERSVYARHLRVSEFLNCMIGTHGDGILTPGLIGFSFVVYMCVSPIGFEEQDVFVT